MYTTILYYTAYSSGEAKLAASLVSQEAKTHALEKELETISDQLQKKVWLN